jgi:hypothetical protein
MARYGILLWSPFKVSLGKRKKKIEKEKIP